MTNRKLKVVSVKLPASALGKIPGNRSAFIRNAIEEKLAREQGEPWKPKTALGRKLASFRQRYLESGGEILDREGIAEELRSRRGGVQ